MTGLAAAVLLMAAGPAPTAAQGAAQAALFDPGGFRADRYRAPVDRSPAPARAIATAEVQRLSRRRGAILVDVLPAEGAHRDPAGAWVLAAPHQSIPGALWFPEVGRAAPAADLWAAFARRVAAAAAVRPRAQIVVFCRADCWMSWNAARRLALAGTAQVRWYGDGIDGWRDHGGALVTVHPERAPPLPITQGD